MTRMLVVVETVAALEAALVGGADGVVLRCGPDADADLLTTAGAAARGRGALSLLFETERDDGAGLGRSCGAAELFVPLSAARAPVSGEPVPRIALLPDMAAVRDETFDGLAAAGFAGVVLGGGGARRLLAGVAAGDLQRQVDGARAHGLVVGFGGPLEAPDIPRLLALAPDLLLVDAVAWRGEDGGTLTPERLRVLRDLIPRTDTQTPSEPSHGHDRIFVRDWTVPIRVGAYRHENEAQRVRFSVEAEVTRRAARADDLRDIVSYDLITDAIARATVAHVELVETLAEDVARAVLAHPRVIAVDITVEKLDLGPGSVGCRLRRTRERRR